MFWCSGCRQNRPTAGQGLAMVANSMVTVCATCVHRVERISADEQLQLHEELATITSFTEIFREL